MRTFILAENLSQKALLDGLKAGHAYVSVNGCEMSLAARCGDREAIMGDTLCVHGDEEAEVRVALHRHPRGNLFVYQNGRLLESCYVDHESPAEYTFRVKHAAAEPNSYVRVEFYEVEGALPYYGYSWRSWQTLRLISNPNYFRRGV